jgi:hypothetical protein
VLTFSVCGRLSDKSEIIMFLFPAFITGLAALLFAVTTRMVGVARGRYKVAPPTTVGHPDFERYYRVQANTMEQLVLFLPSLWLFAVYVSADGAGALGAVWLVGRALYMRGYYQTTQKRIPGFIIGLASAAMLLMGGLVGIVWQWLQP